MTHEQNVRLWEGGGSQHGVGGCYGSVEGMRVSWLEPCWDWSPGCMSKGFPDLEEGVPDFTKLSLLCDSSSVAVGTTHQGHSPHPDSSSFVFLASSQMCEPLKISPLFHRGSSTTLVIKVAMLLLLPEKLSEEISWSIYFQENDYLRECLKLFFSIFSLSVWTLPFREHWQNTK